MVRKAIEVNVNEVVEKRDLHLSSHEKNMLCEFIDLFEPLEDANRHSPRGKICFHMFGDSNLY